MTTGTVSDNASDGIDATKNCMPSNEQFDRDRQDLGDIFKKFRSDPLGCADIGVDGVLRSLAADREVLDAVGLPSRLIKALLDVGPFVLSREDKNRGVVGTNVPKEQWFHPDKSLLPPPLGDEEKSAVIKRLQDDREKIDQARKERESGVRQRCTPVAQSNYNLESKG